MTADVLNFRETDNGDGTIDLSIDHETVWGNGNVGLTVDVEGIWGTGNVGATVYGSVELGGDNLKPVATFGTPEGADDGFF